MNIFDWSNAERIQFIIDTTGMDVEVVPFPVKISYDVGLNSYDNTYIFDKLSVNGSSTGNRKKLLFTQVYGGEEVALHCELDFWDHINRRALFWVKPKTFYNNNINIFYIYYDKTKYENVAYISETSSLPVSLLADIGFNGTYDTAGILPFSILKINNVYKLWFWGNDGSKYRILYSESNNFEIWSPPILSIDLTHSYDASGYNRGTILYDEGIYKIWASVDAGSGFIYSESLDGITWGSFRRVLLPGATNFDSVSIFSPCVLKINNKYRMWYMGVNGGYGRILTCDSLDGINWYGNVLVLSYSIVSGAVQVIPSNVVYVDNQYIMYFEANSSGWVSYYCTSVNGIDWSNISTFARFNMQGTYDNTSTTSFCLLVEEDFYTFVYAGYSSKWRTLYSRSSSLFDICTPSQSIWVDKFISVNHLNNIYGYKDSTNNELHLSKYSNTQLTTGILGTPSFIFNRADSYLDFGNNALYDFSKTVNALIFGKFNSGSIIFNKRTHYALTLHYVSNTVANSYNDSFQGPDYSQPSSLLWTGHVPPSNVLYRGYILNNKLYMYTEGISSGTTTLGYIYLYYLEGDFDVQVDFSGFYTENTSSSAGYGACLNIVELNNSNDAFIRAISYYGAKYVANIKYNNSYKGAVYITRNNNYGKFRITRLGNLLQIYYIDGTGGWVLIMEGNYSTAPVRLYLQLFTSTYTTYVYFSNFAINNYYNLIDTKGELKSNSLTLSSKVPNSLSVNQSYEYILSNDWQLYSAYKTNEGSCNVGMGVGGFYDVAGYVPSIGSSSDNILVGSTIDSIQGEVSEVWFANKVFNSDTLAFLNKALRDEVVSFSRYYVQGYLTEYNKAVNKKIAVYSNTTNQLLSISYSRVSDGYYYCEVPTNSECFLVAFFGSKYNHFILGKILPRQV